MRKISLALFICLLGVYCLAAQSITVTPPARVDGWCPGTPFVIGWISSGVNQNVTIALRFAGSAPDAAPALVIATGEANDGSFPWTIPASIAPGSYFIRVRADDASVRGDGRSFAISRPSIVVTSPAAGNETWYVNVASPITWTSTCLAGARIKIDLYQGANRVRVITPDTGNSGSFPWTVPDGLISPTPYYFRVSTVDNAIHSDSFPFKISMTIIGAMAFAPPAGPRMIISSPLCHGSFRRGTHVTVNFRIEGTCDPQEPLGNRVIYDLLQPNGNLVGTMSSTEGCPSTGPNNINGADVILGQVRNSRGNGWNSVPAGSYKIRVHFTYGGNRIPAREISDTCGEFTVTD